MKNLYNCFILLLSLLVQPIFAQLTPEQAVAEMGRGINLGNTLEPPREGEWNNGPAQESYFDAYREAGFSNVRIPVRWDLHTGNSAPFAINETWMNRVEEVVDWGLERGFYITLNGHHEDWIKTGYSNTNLRARYDSIWVQIADRFKDKSEKLLFEIINEPKGMTEAQVDDLNKRILGIIRKNNPTRLVIYGGNEWANSEQLIRAEIPDDDYIIGYYHAYDPWPFSGEGNGTWGTTSDYSQLTNKYRAVKTWSDRNNVPIHHSEFGAVHACDFNSRMRIYAHNVEQCIVNGFAFSVWDDGGNFGVLNRANNTWPEIKDVLMHYHQDSPNRIFSTFSLDPDTEEPTIKVEWNNRAAQTENIILERSVGGSSTFTQIADLPSIANSYIDKNVESGKTYTYRMYTTRADGTLLHGYPTRVRITATRQTPFNGSAIPIPGTLEVEEYDNGGEGLAYHDTDPQNIPAGFRVDEGVDIGAFGNGYILEYVARDEWIEYTVNVAQTGTYNVTAETGSEQSNGRFRVDFEKNNATTSFTVPATGSWTVFQQINASNDIELEAGEQQMRLTITNDTPFNVDNLSFNLKSVDVSDILATQMGFRIFPNPTEGILNVELSNALQEQDVQLELFKITGEKMGVFYTDGPMTTLQMAGFANGLYLLRLVGRNLNLVQRFMLI